MYPASAAFATAVNKSHTACSKMEIYDGTTMVATTEENDFILTDGNVTADRTASTRRKISFTVNDPAPPSLVPGVSDWFDPLSYLEFKPWRGIQFPDGTKEFVPLGSLFLDRSEIIEDHDGVTIHCDGSDKSVLVSDNKWTTTFEPSADITVAAAALEILLDRAEHFDGHYNSISVGTGSTVPLALTFGPNDDPWEAIRSLADGAGLEAYFDVLGRFIVGSIPSPSSLDSPLVSYVEGPTGVRLFPTNKMIDRKEARSGVTVRSSAPWLLYPVEATVWDTDPNSPTYHLGPFGETPEVIESAIITNVDDATAAAQAKFDLLVGVVDDIQFNALVDPRLDVGDLIGIESPKTNTTGNYVLQTLTIPLLAATGMAGTTKKRRR